MLSRNNCCREKAMIITYSECVSAALFIQYAMRMRRIILSSVACLVVPHFFTLSYIRHDFRQNITEHKICVLIFCTALSSKFLILRRIQPDILSKIYKGLHVKHPLFLSGLNETLFLSTDFLKTITYEISSRRRGVPCGLTDMTKVIVDFSNFVNADKFVHSAHAAFASCFISEQRAYLPYII